MAGESETRHEPPTLVDGRPEVLGGGGPGALRGDASRHIDENVSTD